MYNHNKAQQSKNRVHIFWDILYFFTGTGAIIWLPQSQWSADMKTTDQYLTTKKHDQMAYRHPSEFQSKKKVFEETQFCRKRVKTVF